MRIMAPFHYYGIGDESVNYQEISWRNNKFDHNELVNQLATQARANHAPKHWNKLKQKRTLAFCISKKHADFMAAHFVKQGVKAVSVHSESDIRRNDALSQLEAGRIEVVFSVDLFHTGAWQAGHVCPSGSNDQFILITLNKQGKVADHQYHGYFSDGETFHWQTQNSVGPDGGRGRGLIDHKINGSKLHLFVRKNKLEAKKAAPFYYCGPMEYVSHEGEKPMSVVTKLENELSEYLKLEFMGSK